MKTKYAMPHVPYQPDSNEIFATGKQAALANRGIGIKPNLAVLRQWMPLFAGENSEAQKEALAIFAQGWREVKR